MTGSARFWDRVARKYAARPVGDPEAYHATLERTKAHLKADQRVLEVGCGTGTTALILAPATGHLTATDVSGEMIAIAREKLSAGDPGNVAFEQAELTPSGLPAGPFDAVLAFNLLHLVEDLPAALQALRGRLVPGGLLISKTVCLGGWRALLLWPLIAAMRLFGKAPHVAFLKPAEMDRMVAEAGFEIIETGFYPVRSASRFIVARKA
ncbi:class I SAM-dependent methyltransferase [Stappia sp.]|uniref:class I SAM-dependent methyltransferase n=1 Tax=Stappia sp. TaxID=1870903 RepID=UPI003D0EA351